MLGKYKWAIYIVGIILLILGVVFVGDWLGGVIGAILVAVGLKQSKTEQAMNNIEEAGEGYEAKKHDAESAIQKIDDIVGKQGDNHEKD